MEKDNHKTLEEEGIPSNFHFHAPVGQVNIRSNVTSTIGNIGDSREVSTTKGQTTIAIDKTQLRDEIIEYVGRIESFYSVAWQQHYKELWNDILDMPVVAIKVYDHGHQHDTNFNRNLVGNIIGYLDRFNVYQDPIVPGTFTHKLAKDGKGKSVRDALGGALDPEICEAIKKLMEKKKYV